MTDVNFRLIIIDDNPKIAQDVIKVLSNKAELNDDFDALDEVLFGTPNDKSNNKKSMAQLPNFSFTTATQGQEGVEIIRQALERGEHYALAFVDVRMPPGWDGIETIKRMWQIDPFIQVVICTAYSDYSWEATIDELGVSSNFLILKKPFDNLAIRQLAFGLVQKWLLDKTVRQNTVYLEKQIAEKTASLHHAFSLLRILFDSTTEGVLVLDFENTLIDCNLRFQELFEIEKNLVEAKCGQKILSLLRNNVHEPSKEFEHMLLANDKETIFQETIQLKNNKIYELTSRPYFVNSQAAGRFWSVLDVSERVAMSKRLTHQATHDPLTNLPNRALLRDRLSHGIIESERLKKRVAILFFDLDRFKLVNDSLGHEVGDQILCLASERIQDCLRKGDTVARLGGDEFVIVLTQLTKREDAHILSNRLIMSFQAPFIVAGQEINVTTSIGVSMYPEDGSSVDALLRKADLAMYQAKSLRRNNCYFYDKELNDESGAKLKLVSELKHAIDEKQFILFYQPQFDLQTGLVVGLEALIRWQHPNRGLIGPSEFIPEAEESGLIIAIGEWVLEEVCRQINDWRHAGLPCMQVAVNISSWQLRQRNFHKVVKDILKRHNMAPHCLQIEITENVIVSQLEVMKMIEKLRKLDLKIILDDFGTANSSLHYITEIPIDGVKIDRSYIKNIAKSHNHEAIIEAIISIANNLNLKLVAEGVDDKIQETFLRNKACGILQGFLYCEPVTALAIVELLNNKLTYESQ